MRKVIFEKYIANFIAALMFILVVAVCWQVITRYILNDPSQYTEELLRYVLIWLGLFGGAYGCHALIHPSLPVLVDKLAGKKRLWADVFVLAIIWLSAFFILIIGGVSLVKLAWVLEQTSAALEIKMALVYLALPLSGVLICYAAMDEMWLTYKNWKGR